MGPFDFFVQILSTFGPFMLLSFFWLFFLEGEGRCDVSWRCKGILLGLKIEEQIKCFSGVCYVLVAEDCQWQVQVPMGPGAVEHLRRWVRWR